MPKVKVEDITMNYVEQGAGEPLILIPFVTADNAWIRSSTSPDRIRTSQAC
jgi:hypothetical protein